VDERLCACAAERLCVHCRVRQVTSCCRKLSDAAYLSSRRSGIPAYGNDILYMSRAFRFKVPAGLLAVLLSVSLARAPC
jgi:hypothetical protein